MHTHAGTDIHEFTPHHPPHSNRPNSAMDIAKSVKAVSGNDAKRTVGSEDQRLNF